MITAEELLKVCPSAKSIIDQFVDPLNDALHTFEIDNIVRVAAFLGQVAHESGEFRWLKELWGPTAAQSHYDTRADLGNTLPEAIAIAAQHGSTPGKWWRGHGLIQLTGYLNHKKTGEALGLDLLNDPEQIAKPVGACLSAALFWKEHGCNELADVNDYASITRRINGGMNGWSSRLEYWHRAKLALGVIDHA